MSLYDILFGPGGIERTLNGIIWGIPAMVLILGTGIYLSARCGFLQFAKFGHIIKNTLGKAFKKSEHKEGTVSPFKAMCTALAASIGTGNIAGVSGAIALGGPGAVFWMWISALLGMCTKYAEVTLAIKFRQKNSKGDYVGGPMYYITNGLGKKWKWLAVLFAIFGAIASIGTGNLVQVNTIAKTVNTAIIGFTPLTDQAQTTIAIIIGIICAVVAAIVLIGGIQRIGDFCATLVPAMAIIFILASIGVIIFRIDQIPAAFAAIFQGAFNPQAVVGGGVGITIKMAMTKGVARGIFSNEAGLGSAPIAHAAADVDHPVKQGIYGVFEVFMDTVIVCTMTALVVLLGNGVGGIEFGNDIGANLAINGFTAVYGGKIPAVVVAICLSLFAFTTTLTWALYGSRCTEFLFGEKAGKPYLVFYCLLIVIGAVTDLSLAWNIADTFNGLMAIPNLIALLVLSPIVIKLTREYFDNQKKLK